MTESASPRLVKAQFNFKGSNNDELCFSRGDVITVTQVVEGGWWEGTLGGKTGWFPSNYVKEVKSDPSRAKSPTGKQPSAPELKMNKRESMLVYHNVVLQSLIDTERTYVNDLHGLFTSFMKPLQSASVLSNIEYTHLVGNLDEIAALHQSLLSSLDECAKNPVAQQRIGGIFLKTAHQLKTKYSMYCGNHPRAVAVLQQRKDDLSTYMEGRGAPPPGVMTLTTSLSKPFSRMEKYSNLLKELERHTEESHIDRGDTQRAISVYREISASCTELRRQKEMEYEILNSTIKNWEGEDVSKLGEVLLLSQVRVHVENRDKTEQLFLLFPGVLVLLSVSPRMSGYTYEGKIPVSGLNVTALEEESESHTHAFEISGPMIDTRVVNCLTRDERQRWVDMLQHQAKHGPNKAKSIQVPTPQAVTTNVTPAKTLQAAHHPYRPATKMWVHSCLRPSPPLRPSLFLKDDPQKSPRSGRKLLGTSRRKPVDDTKTLEDDALLLKVIEAYCSSARARQTVNSLDLTKIRLTPRELKKDGMARQCSTLLDSPQVLIAEEEKIIMEEIKGNQTIVEEKSLVDTVYLLKDQMKDMKQEQQRLRKDLEDEKHARKRLETLLRKSVRSLIESTSTLEPPHDNTVPVS